MLIPQRRLTPRWSRLRQLVSALSGWARGRRGGIILALLVAWIIGVTPVGEHLNAQLYFEPLLKMRARTGLQPQLEPSLRLVVQDDYSLQKLGRTLTFGEWAEIAEALFAAGYEKVFLLGFPDLRASLGQTPKRSGRGEFVLGAVLTDGVGNPRAIPTSDVPARLFVPARDPVGPRASAILVPASEALAFADRLGLMNATSEHAVPSGVGIDGDRFLPHLALHGLRDLAWSERGPTSAGALVPVSVDGTLVLDVPTLASIGAASIRSAVFFDAAGKLRPGLPARSQAKLSGGRIALLVPEAFTGTRFIDSPLGKVPSYMAVVALVSDAVLGRFARVPVAAWQLTLLASPLLFALALMRRTDLVAGTAAGAAVAIAAVASALFQWRGWLLPTAQLEGMLLAGALARLTRDALSTAVERAALARDLEVGKLVQQSFLPHCNDGAAGSWRYRIVFRPHSSMSGDWFQAFAPQRTPVGAEAVLAIGDGLGKGAGAALCTAVIATVWRRLQRGWREGSAVDARQIVEELDEALVETFDGKVNSTLSLAVLWPDRITVTSIASPGWLVFRQGTRTVDRLRRIGSNPLGLTDFPREAATIEAQSVELAPGDILVICTDGVIETAAAERRLVAVMTDLPWDASTEDLFDAIARKALGLAASQAAPDDATILMIRREPQAAQDLLMAGGWS